MTGLRSAPAHIGQTTHSRNTCATGAYLPAGTSAIGEREDAEAQDLQPERLAADGVEIRKRDKRVVSEVLSLRRLQYLISQLRLDVLVLAEERQRDRERV